MPITKTNITHQVIEYIKDNINNNIWKIGDKIPSENRLVQELNVSRSSIRSAIQQFIAISALESIQGKGTFVRSNDLRAFSSDSSGQKSEIQSDIVKALEFRMIIEPESCFLAAKHATFENLENMERYLEYQRNYVGDSEQTVRFDMLFHMEIAKASCNHYIENSLAVIQREKISDHRVLNELYGYKDGLYFHHIILKALRDRKPKLAKDLMTEHLRQNIDRPIIRELLKQK